MVCLSDVFLLILVTALGGLCYRCRIILLLLVLWKAVYVAAYQHRHLHGQLLLFFQQLRVMVLVRRHNNSVSISVKCKLLLATGGGGPNLSWKFHSLERAISVIVVE